jgi:hypothetical protein
MKSKTITHFTNIQHLPSILNDQVLRLEGHNIEYMLKQVQLGFIPIDQIVHPSGHDINHVWHAMCRQYRLTGRYVWLTEEEDVRCITAQRNFEKVGIEFDADIVKAKRWVDVMAAKSKKSIKAKKLIKRLNWAAIHHGDDITKWWVVERDIPLALCKSITHNEKVAA